MRWIILPSEAREIRHAVQQMDGLTVQEFAERLGYTDRDSVYRIERGKFRPSVQASEAMMKELNRLYRRKAFVHLAAIRKAIRERRKRLA